MSAQYENSCQSITVTEWEHTTCGNSFYELEKGTEVENCPHCGETINLDSVARVTENDRDIVVDAKTGEIINE